MPTYGFIYFAGTVPSLLVPSRTMKAIQAAGVPLDTFKHIDEGWKTIIPTNQRESVSLALRVNFDKVESISQSEALEH